MAKTGRKTHADYRAESAIIPGAKIPAPFDLEPAAVVFWDGIVARLPEDFFTFETLPLLKAYCRHAVYADWYAQEIADLRCEIEDLAKTGCGHQKLAKLRTTMCDLHKLHGYETDHAATCATKLRLTNQSRFYPESARARATQMHANVSAAAPPPWHDWGIQAGTGN